MNTRTLNIQRRGRFTNLVFEYMQQAVGLLISFLTFSLGGKIGSCEGSISVNLFEHTSSSDVFLNILVIIMAFFHDPYR